MEAWRDVIRLWLRARVRKARVNRDLDDELQFHLNRHADTLVDEGMPASDAHQTAREQLGDLDAIKQRTRDAADEGSRLALDEWRLLTMLPRSVNFKALVSTLVILGALGGYAVGRVQPPLYRSEARLMVSSLEVATDLVATSPPVEFRLEVIQGMMLSKRRVDGIVEDFNLYPDLPTLEERAAKLRSHVVLTPSVIGGRYLTIRFTGTDPIKVMKVTEILAGAVKDLTIEQHRRMTENTRSLLEGQAEEAGQRLTAHLAAAKATGTLAEPRARLETEVLESTYRQLLTSLEGARGRLMLARRRWASNSRSVEQARMVERPITPDPMQQAGVGALAGLAAAIVIAIAVLGTRMWHRPPAASVAELA